MHVLVLEMPCCLPCTVSFFLVGQLSQEPTWSHKKRIKADLASSPGLPGATGGLQMVLAEIPANAEVLQACDYLSFVKLT